MGPGLLINSVDSGEVEPYFSPRVVVSRKIRRVSERYNKRVIVVDAFNHQRMFSLNGFRKT